jgi:hypothetical protein
MYFEKNIMNLIFSFDNTYKNKFDYCLTELKKNNCIKEFKKDTMLRIDNLYIWLY